MNAPTGCGPHGAAPRAAARKAIARPSARLRGLFSPATIPGVTQPVDTAQDFVLGPLATLATADPAIAAPLATYRAASPAQQVKWASAYDTAVAKVKFVSGAPVIPGLRDIPRLIPVHRLIWRSWYRSDPEPVGGADAPRPSDKTPAGHSQ